jgi:hypothetical protein
MTATLADPIDSIPDPDTVRRMIADNVRRTELLRQLLRLSTRRETLLRGERPRAGRKAVTK